jgi:hypothetical protein
MAKGKKTGGRKKGSRNKATIALEQELAASGETPKDYMLRVMRDPKVDDHRRDEMAKAVAPYVPSAVSNNPSHCREQEANPDGGECRIRRRPRRAGRESRSACRPAGQRHAVAAGEDQLSD